MSGIRISNLCVDHKSGFLFVSDDRGLVRKLSPELEVLATSPATKFGAFISAIGTDGLNVYTRDIAGTLVKYNAETLQGECNTFTEQIYSERFAGASPAYNPSQTLALHEESVFTTNPFGEVIEFNKVDLNFVRLYTHSSTAMIESIVVDEDGTMYASDVLGGIWALNTSAGCLEYIKPPATPYGTSHSLVIDKQHSRLWCSTDNHGGVVILSKNGNDDQLLKFTDDDVEEIVFSHDGEFAYIACFDHYVYKYKNHKTPELVAKFGPFKFQLAHIEIGSENTIFISLESGEVYCLNCESGEVLAERFGTDAIWGIELSDVDGEAYAALESGGVLRIRLDETAENRVALSYSLLVKDLGMGRVRRATPIDSVRLVCITTAGSVICLDRHDGRVLWFTQLEGILRDMCQASDQTSVFVCSEKGVLTKVRIVDGHVISQWIWSRPLWCIASNNAGKLIVGQRSLNSKGDINIVDEDSMKIIHSVALEGNPKRIRILDSHTAIVVGNGEFYIRTLKVQSGTWEKVLNKWVFNTVENALIFNNRIYGITYGQQLVSFDCETSEVKSVQFNTESFPKGIASFSSKFGSGGYLVIGGRDFLSIFRASDVMDPVLLRTFYLSALTTAMDSPKKVVQGESHENIGSTSRLSDESVVA
jgi:outer membrane protein assembly factor BamB